MKFKILVWDKEKITNKVKQIEVGPGKHIAFAYASEFRILKEMIEPFEGYRVDSTAYKTYSITSHQFHNFTGHKLFKYGVHILRVKFLIVSDRPFRVIQFGRNPLKLNFEKNSSTGIKGIMSKKTVKKSKIIREAIMKEKEKGLNIAEASINFKKTRDDFIAQLAIVDDMRIFQQVKKILRTKDAKEIYSLVLFLNACCQHSRRRFNLLKYKIGRNTFKKLERAGLHLCNCTVLYKKKKF